MVDILLRRSDIDRMKTDLYRYIDTFPSRRTKKTIMENAAQKRRITTGPRKGMYDPYYTPFWIEPIDNMSVGSPIERSITMKSVQSGSTTGMENGINYYISEEPADQLYLSGTEKLLTRWVETKLDPSIDSFGNRGHIKTISDSVNYKKSGDTVLRKSYFGCSLDMVSARSGSDLRQMTKQVLWLDEVDSAPKTLASGEGNFLEVVNGRIASFGSRAKTYVTSTPTLADSLIYSEFLKGDRRYFMVPCPVCGVFQRLEFGDDYSEYGLKGEIDDENRVLDCYYLCRECGSHIKEHNKTMMLSEGYWEPTANGESSYIRSYSINALYSPIGMGFDWSALYKKWLSSKENIQDLISFTNLYIGEPYFNTEDKINADDLIGIESGYKQRDIPDGVLFLTAGIDVQKGSSVDKKNPPRIEMEIVGHGRRYKTWGIEYKVFYGSTDDEFSGAWDKLYKFCVETCLSYKNSNGVRFGVVLSLVDSGEGKNSGTVYNFCKRLKNFFPSKGFRELKAKKGEKYEFDMPGAIDKIRYRVSGVGSDTRLIEIATVYYKDLLYDRLKKERVTGDIQNPGFCDFPSDYTAEFFKQLTSEVKADDGSYSNQGRRNESLDCRVYALCAADVYLDEKVEQLRKAAIKNGATVDQAREKIRTPVVLRLLEQGIDRQLRKLVQMRNRR